MGSWGTAAWDNDSAADWFSDTFNATGLAQLVEEALERDPKDAHQEIRAAAHILVALGHVYVWPIHYLDDHLQLAISKLESIRDMDFYREIPGFAEAIEDEIEELRSRLNPPLADA